MVRNYFYAIPLEKPRPEEPVRAKQQNIRSAPVAPTGQTARLARREVGVSEDLCKARRSPMDFGIDALTPSSPLARALSGKRLAVLAHPASVDRGLVHISDKLAKLALTPQVYFGPEHGFGGEAQDMIGVSDARSNEGVPIRSLYGENFSDLTPTREDFAGIDVLLMDLADVGSRYYTFVWTCLLALRKAAECGVKTVLLDRPNPIGRALEGRTLSDSYRSFVGLEPIPIRHGMTVGEIVALFAAREKIAKDAFTIIPCRGVPRDASAPEWDRAFVLPSPNMPTYETALVYPGGCLLEGTNLSEGRGTTRPFEITGAPFVDGPKLAAALNALELPGFVARPLTFLPQFQKHAKTTCGGVQIHVTDAKRFQPVRVYTALIALAHHHHPKEFRFRTERYEFRDDVPRDRSPDRRRKDAREHPRAREPAFDCGRAVRDDCGRSCADGRSDGCVLSLRWLTGRVSASSAKKKRPVEGRSNRALGGAHFWGGVRARPHFLLCVVPIVGSQGAYLRKRKETHWGGRRAGTGAPFALLESELALLESELAAEIVA